MLDQFPLPQRPSLLAVLFRHTPTFKRILPLVGLAGLCLVPQAASAQIRSRGAAGDRGRLGFLSGRLDDRFGGTNPAPIAIRPPNRALVPPPFPRPGVVSGGVVSGPFSGRFPSGRAAPIPPPNRVPYTGPGVFVRMPAELPGEVHFLVDDDEHLVIQSGEEQSLRIKGSYEVRFSRGVTEEGHSLGEAHYTITEGIYRFAATESGWELYREPDLPSPVAQANYQAVPGEVRDRLRETRSSDFSNNLPDPLQRSEQPADAPQENTRVRSAAGSQTPVPPTPVPPTKVRQLDLGQADASSNDVPRNDIPSFGNSRDAAVPPPIPTPPARDTTKDSLPDPLTGLPRQPAKTEDTLPTPHPRSILER